MSQEAKLKETYTGRDYNETICSAFNDQWPIGSAVYYVDDIGELNEKETRTKATTHPSGPIVWLKNHVGAVLLSRVIPINPSQS